MRKWAMAVAVMILFPWVVSLMWMRTAGDTGAAAANGEPGQQGETVQVTEQKESAGQETWLEKGPQTESQTGDLAGQGYSGAADEETANNVNEGQAEGKETGFEGISEGEKPRVLRKILVERKGLKTYIEAEDYLPGVMVCQIYGDCSQEALKCQAVIARTYLYRLMDGRTEIYEEELDLDYLGESQAARGADREQILDLLERCREAADATRGVVMKYNDRYILPLFHSISAGRTRMGDEQFPYLQSVESASDTRREDYMQVKEWSWDEFAAAVNQIPGAVPVEAGQVSGQIQTVKKDDAGYMEQIKIGAKIYTGDEIQYALGLPSPCFSLESSQEGVRVRTRGRGHGYGLSQAGADSMAREGWGYEDILNHYYKNILLISE